MRQVRAVYARPFVDIAAVSTAYVLIHTKKVRCTVVVVQTPHSRSHTTTTTISVTGTAINDGRVTDISRRSNTSQQRNACVSLICAYELTMVQWCEVCWYTQREKILRRSHCDNSVCRCVDAIACSCICLAAWRNVDGDLCICSILHRVAFFSFVLFL